MIKRNMVEVRVKKRMRVKCRTLINQLYNIFDKTAILSGEVRVKESSEIRVK